MLTLLIINDESGRNYVAYISVEGKQFNNSLFNMTKFAYLLMYMNCIIHNGYFTSDDSEPLVRLVVLYCVLHSNIVESKCSVLLLFFLYSYKYIFSMCF